MVNACFLIFSCIYSCHFGRNVPAIFIDSRMRYTVQGAIPFSMASHLTSLCIAVSYTLIISVLKYVTDFARMAVRM